MSEEERSCLEGVYLLRRSEKEGVRPFNDLKHIRASLKINTFFNRKSVKGLKERGGVRVLGTFQYQTSSIVLYPVQ